MKKKNVRMVIATAFGLRIFDTMTVVLAVKPMLYDIVCSSSLGPAVVQFKPTSVAFFIKLCRL